MSVGCAEGRFTGAQPLLLADVTYGACCELTKDRKRAS